MGRPSKLTPTLQEEICDRLATGNTIETACGLAGISVDTFYEWYNHGEACKAGVHREFSEAIKKAKVSAEAYHIKGIYDRVRNWQASAWWLERTNPKYRLPREAPAPEAEHVALEEILAVINRALESDPDAKERILAVLEELK